MRTANLVRFPLALATVLGISLLAWLAITTAVHANPYTVSASGGSVNTGATITSTLTVTPTGGEQVGGGVVDVVTPAGLTVQSCAGATGVIANCNYNSTGNVRFVFGQTTPFSGQLGTITYLAGTSLGAKAIDVQVSQCASTTATVLDCSATDATITVTAPGAGGTTPTVTGTTVPGTTPGAAALPTTGGSTGDSSMNWALPLFIVAGLALVSGSAAWGLHRSRSR